MMARPARCPVHGVAASTAYRYRRCRCVTCSSAEACRRRKKYGARRAQYLESNRAYYEANREQVRETQREWNGKNRDKMREYRRRWAERHPAGTREARSAWRRRNREAVNAEARRRRARKRGAVGECSMPQLQARIEFYGGLCYLCGAQYEAIDHVIPLARGGSEWPANLRPICQRCNSSKGARPLSQVAA